MRSVIRIFILCTLVSVSAQVSVSSLEVTEGRVKLVLYEDMGRFSLYYLVDPEKKKYVSLFVDQDIRTSYLSLFVDNKVYKMGEASQFKETVEKKGSGALRTWVSDWIDVYESFGFFASGSRGIDGIRIRLTIKNKSGEKKNVGARYLFDTYLGERTQVHFTTDKLTKMENETMFESGNMIQYWISPEESEGEPVKVGLKMICTGSGVTTPDRIVFANWKRLSDSLWSYTPPKGRNFSVRPYSINDSAVAVYYNPEQLEPGASRDIALSLGFVGSSKGETSGTGTESEEAKKQAEKELLEILAAKEKKDTQRKSYPVSKENLKIIDDLTTIENLVDEINKILFSGDEISEKDMKIMEQMIAELKERVKNY
jgi:hypothetical protein